MTGITSFNLTGKRALITGAAGLLGQEHAAALAEVGCDVVLTDVGEDRLHEAMDKLAKTYGDKMHCMTMDVTNESSIQNVAKNIGDIDILVNNAAIDPKVTAGNTGLELSRLEHFPLEQWDRQISVGLTGAFLCSRIFGTPMAERKSGVILNIASDLAVIAPDQRIYRKDGLPNNQQPVKPVTYSVIKTALLGLTRYLASYWANQGVRVNALSPGGVFNNHPEEFVQRLTNLIPMERMAEASEYRATVQFLCSPASSYMTGQNIVVDGGRSIL
jgi:hypothetical protein